MNVDTGTYPCILHCKQIENIDINFESSLVPLPDNPTHHSPKHLLL